MVYSSLSAPEVGLLRGLLEQAGIACEVRNENIFATLPGAAFQPEVWILNDDDYSRACEVRDAWRQPLPEQASCPPTQEASAEERGVLPSKAWRRRQKVWRQQVLIPAVLWLVVFFLLAGTYTFVASFLFGLATALWAAIDCSRLQDRGSRLLGLAFKPVVVFGVCTFFLWGLGFIWYLVMRHRVKTTPFSLENQDGRVSI